MGRPKLHKIPLPLPPCGGCEGGDPWGYCCKSCKKTRSGWRTFQNQARARSIPVSLELWQWVGLVTQPCTYCGDGGADAIVGIDRVDNAKGYTPENSVPCCTMCNRMKLNHGRGQFLEQVEKIYWHAKWGEERIDEDEGQVERFIRETTRRESVG